MKIFLTLWYLLISFSKRAQAKGKYIAVGTIAVLLASGGVAVYTSTTGGSDLCGASKGNGTWEMTGAFIDLIDDNSRINEYVCADEGNKKAYCTRLSASKRTCYPALTLQSTSNVLLADIYRTEEVVSSKLEEHYIVNHSCIKKPAIEANGTPEHYLTCVQVNETEIVVVRSSVSVYDHQELFFKGEIIRTEARGCWCYENTTAVICKSLYDGNGWQRIPGLSPGMEVCGIIQKSTKTILPTTQRLQSSALFKEAS